MAPQNLTEYERRRLENIKRNDEMLAALKIPSKLSELNVSAKRPRPQQKSYKVSPEKKQRNQTPIVLRRSLRSQGVRPDASSAGGLKDVFDENARSMSKKRPASATESEFKEGPIRLKDAYGEVTDKKLLETILQCCRKSEFKDNGVTNWKSTDVKEEKQEFASSMVGQCCRKSEFNDNGVANWESTDVKEEKQEFASSMVERKICSSLDVQELILEPENIARVVHGRIFTVKFFPTTDVRLVAVGNKDGDVGFWNVDAEGDDTDDGIYIYRPHTAPISGIGFNSFTLQMMLTSSYDGFIRLMDVEKELFDVVYSCDEPIYSLSRKPDDVMSLYFGEGSGGDIRIWDLRSGKSSSSWSLHEKRISTIDFNSQNTNIMATSSTDGTVAIWDLRRNSMCKPRSLKEIHHQKAVHSAYFSPSGKLLATTSVDDRVGLVSGMDYDELSMIYHNNHTGRWISPFRGIWGWDDSYVFIGNMNRGADVISTAGKKMVATLQSELLTAIPCRFDAHPYEVGTLAGATGGGQVYIWKKPS